MQPRIIKAQTLKENRTPEGCFLFENWGASTGDGQVSIARARVGPGATTKAHHLEGVQEIYLIAEGEGTVTVDGMEPAQVCKGDVVVIPAGASQKITNTGKADFVFHCICTPAFTQECYRNDELQNR